MIITFVLPNLDLLLIMFNIFKKEFFFTSSTTIRSDLVCNDGRECI